MESISTMSGAHGCSIAKVRLRPTLPHSRHQQPLPKAKGNKSYGAYHLLSVDHLFLYTYFGRAPFIRTRTDNLTVLRSFNNYVHTFALQVTTTLDEMTANVNPLPFRPTQPEHDFKHIPCYCHVPTAQLTWWDSGCRTITCFLLSERHGP
jgi:hypothetical protein